jgi:hypothetical protein
MREGVAFGLDSFEIHWFMRELMFLHKTHESPETQWYCKCARLLAKRQKQSAKSKAPPLKGVDVSMT